MTTNKKESDHVSDKRSFSYNFWFFWLGAKELEKSQMNQKKIHSTTTTSQQHHMLGWDCVCILSTQQKKRMTQALNYE